MVLLFPGSNRTWKGNLKLESALRRRTQPFDLKWSVPQGSCLGPLLFTIHTQDLFSILESHLPTSHAYSDDTQLSRASNVSTGEVRAIVAIESCIRDIRQWMCEKKLLLKDDKAEFLLVGSCKQLEEVSIDGVRVGDYNMSPSPSVRILGTWLDSYLSMDVNITKTCASSSAFYCLYNIRHNRKYLSRSSTESLVHAFVTSTVDYCNSLMCGLPKYQLSCSVF